jgi:hypothetical protein
MFESRSIGVIQSHEGSFVLAAFARIHCDGVSPTSILDGSFLSYLKGKFARSALQHGRATPSGACFCAGDIRYATETDDTRLGKRIYIHE